MVFKTGTEKHRSPNPAVVSDPEPRPTTGISTEVELDALLQAHPKVMARTSSKNHTTRKAGAKAPQKLRNITLDDDGVLGTYGLRL